MNLSNMLKTIMREVKKERRDAQLKWALTTILDKLGDDCFQTESVDIDWHDIMGDMEWNIDGGTDKQRAFASKEACKQLERVCTGLRKYGFTCKAFAHNGKVQGSDHMWFGTPFISVDLK